MGTEKQIWDQHCRCREATIKTTKTRPQKSLLLPTYVTKLAKTTSHVFL